MYFKPGMYYLTLRNVYSRPEVYSLTPRNVYSRPEVYSLTLRNEIYNISTLPKTKERVL